ncbi:GtrA family protein [Candidatus Roizmanbacteria bacterium]|nr:GtrA family protein [Candidatus Roizmanbacteria bacterium]
MKKAVIVLPTYNESENIEDMIVLVLAEQKWIKDWELFVLVSDSHSSDGTDDLVRKLKNINTHVELLDVKERGIGVGLLKGYEYAFNKMRADAVIQMDADLQHDPKEIPHFLSAIDEGFSFVQGSRFIAGGRNELEWYRRFFSWSANLYSRVLMGVYKIHEFTTSYRAFTKELFAKLDLSEIPWKGKSFLFQPAFLYTCIYQGAKVKEIPIVFIDRSRGLSKMEIVQYIVDLSLFGIRVRLKKSRRFLKFCVVGTIGFIINTLGLELLVRLRLHPALAGGIGAEAAIISNFFLNNFWTFQEKKIAFKRIPIKLLQFNTTSFGAVLIQSLTIFVGVTLTGMGTYRIFYLLGVGLGLIWNYLMYSRVIWK